MTTKDAIKLVENSGTKIGKDKLIEAIRKTNAKEIAFVKDAATSYTLILVKLS